MKRLPLATLKNIPIDDRGLSEVEARQQRNKFGSNTILDSGRSRWFDVFQDTVRDPMVWFLGAVSLLFFVVGQTTDALTLLLAILPLTFMDAFLHWRTRSATSSLKANLNTTVKVIRDGIETSLNSQDIVPGDLIFVSVGETLPADGIVERSDHLQVDESVLTGESFPAMKRPQPNIALEVERDEIGVSPEVLAYAGTKVLTGHAFLRILQTGASTSYGQIVRSVAEMPNERTPLQASIARLVRHLITAALFFCLLLSLVRLYQGHGWVDSLLAAATLAVAAIPEEFPVVFTFFLGLGVFRLAKRQALVRRAVSVENIGRITHICTDKTGTLTVGRLALSHVEPMAPAQAADLLDAALAASHPAAIDPLDLAISQACAEKSVALRDGTVLRRFPFTEDRRKETAIVRSLEGLAAYTKGAPETILAIVDLTETDRKFVRERIAQYAETGHKVLACAKRVLGEQELSEHEPDFSFRFLGLLAFEDPARPEVPAAIASAKESGIKVIMLTGDHPLTAAAIARDIGLGGASPHVVSAESEGDEFEATNLDAQPTFLQSVDVIARCTPGQKLRVVQALKRQGFLVAVTGDGVNDVPALKAADVGIAMGERGSQSAKETSSIILANDNFRTIIDAVHEGRQLLTNLRAAFEYLLLIHIPLVLSAALLPLLGFPILYLPIHIVWLELIIHPSAILSFQSSAHLKPRRSITGFFDQMDVLRIALAGTAVLALVAWFYVSDLKGGLGIEVARTRILVALSTWSACIVGVLSGFRGLLPKVVVIVTIATSFGLIESGTTTGVLLHVVPLRWSQWVETVCVISGVALLMWGCRFRTRHTAP